MTKKKIFLACGKCGAVFNYPIPVMRDGMVTALACPVCGKVSDSLGIVPTPITHNKSHKTAKNNAIYPVFVIFLAIYTIILYLLWR